jgi:hypothetical protein
VIFSTAGMPRKPFRPCLGSESKALNVPSARLWVLERLLHISMVTAHSGIQRRKTVAPKKATKELRKGKRIQPVKPLRKTGGDAKPYVFVPEILKP